MFVCEDDTLGGVIVVLNEGYEDEHEIGGVKARRIGVWECLRGWSKGFVLRSRAVGCSSLILFLPNRSSRSTPSRPLDSGGHRYSLSPTLPLTSSSTSYPPCISHSSSACARIFHLITPEFPNLKDSPLLYP